MSLHVFPRNDQQLTALCTKGVVINQLTANIPVACRGAIDPLRLAPVGLGCAFRLAAAAA